MTHKQTKHDFNYARRKRVTCCHLLVFLRTFNKPATEV